MSIVSPHACLSSGGGVSISRHTAIRGLEHPRVRIHIFRNPEFGPHPTRSQVSPSLATRFLVSSCAMPAILSSYALVGLDAVPVDVVVDRGLDQARRPRHRSLRAFRRLGIGGEGSGRCPLRNLAPASFLGGHVSVPLSARGKSSPEPTANGSGSQPGST